VGAAFMARWKKELSADSRIPATHESRLGPHGGVAFMVDPTLRAVARTWLDKVAAFSEEPKSLAGPACATLKMSGTPGSIC
jgi:hypothetical protein